MANHEVTKLPDIAVHSIFPQSVAAFEKVYTFESTEIGSPLTSISL
jgi:hypothetical protein